MDLLRRQAHDPASDTRVNPCAHAGVPGVAWLAIAILAAGFVVLSLRLAFVMDDTFISLRYAENLLRGHGLVFNPGERVEGYSNFLWTVLLAAAMRLGLPALAAARVLGVLAAVLAVFVTARLAARASRDLEPPLPAMAAIVAAALVASNTAVAFWSASGMETTLYTLWVALAVESGTSTAPRAQRRAVVWWALASLTRPDGVALAGAWFAWHLWRSRHGALRAALTDVVLYAGLLAPYVVWKLAWYGELLPNTYYAKSGWSLEVVRRGLDDAAGVLHHYAVFGVAPVLGLVALGGRAGPERAVRRGVAWVAAVLAASMVAVGGDVHPMHRFWVAGVPLAVVLLASGAARAVPRLLRTRHAVRAAIGVGLVGIGLVAVGLLQSGIEAQVRAQRFRDAMAILQRQAHWLDDHLGPDATVAATAIGAVAWITKRPVLDLLGLTDPEIARSPQPIAGLANTWKEQRYNAPSVLRRRPAAILFSTGARPSAAAEKALFLYEDFHRSYYPYRFHSTPDDARADVIYRLRPAAPDPPPTYPAPAPPEIVEAFVRGLRNEDSPQRAALARRHFERAAARAPFDFVMARERAAVLAWRAGDPAAEAALRAVVAADSLTLDAHLTLGQAAATRGDLESAVAWFERAARIDPDAPLPWRFLGEAALARGDHDATRRYWEKSLRLDRTDARLRARFEALPPPAASAPRSRQP